MLAGLVPFFICMSITTHEFWIQPEKTHVLVGQRVPLQITVGDNFIGQRWEGKGNRIVSYNHYARNDMRELLLSLAPGDNLVQLPEFIPTTEGTHMLTLYTHPKFVEVAASQFNDYLQEAGFMKAHKFRTENNQMFNPGRERISRCAKVLIQAGEETDNTYKEKTNLLLEIIPDKNPYNHDKTQGLTFKVLYEGNPLPDAMVKWWHKDRNSVETDVLYTSERGEVTFSAAKPGLYMITVAHMLHLDNNRTADWQSTWSSLVFGIEE